MKVKSAGPRLQCRRFDWDEAKRLHAGGMSYYAIGKQFGVSPASIRLACDDEARDRERPLPLSPDVELPDVLDRIANHFEFAADGCWHWTGAMFDNGYGAFWNNDKKRNVRAHRAMYELLVGPVPEGLELDHLCRVRHCINPAHLEPVTRSENARRSPLVGRYPRKPRAVTREAVSPLKEKAS